MTRTSASGAARLRLETIGADRRVSPSRLQDPRSKSPHRRSLSPHRPAASSRYNMGQDGKRVAQVDIPLSGMESSEAKPLTRGRAKNRAPDATSQDVLTTLRRGGFAEAKLEHAVSGNEHAKLGARVKLINLHAHKELNEKEGNIKEFYRNGRIGVQLKDRFGKGKVVSVQEVNVAVAVEQLVAKDLKHKAATAHVFHAGEGGGLSSTSTAASSSTRVSRPRSGHVDVLWMPLRLEETDVYVGDN